MKITFYIFFTFLILNSKTLFSNCDCNNNFVDTVYYNQALKKIESGNISDAIDCLNCAISISKYSEFYNKRGFCYFLLNDKEKAYEDYNNAIKKANPKLSSSSIYYYNIATLELTLNKFEEAKEHFQKSISIYKDNTELSKYELYHNYGVNLLLLNECDSSEFYFKSALDILNKQKANNFTGGDFEDNLYTKLQQYYLLAKDCNQNKAISKSQKIGPDNTFLFSIGLNNYNSKNDSVPPLINAVKDAQDFIKIFKFNFGVSDFSNKDQSIPTRKIKLLTDEDANYNYVNDYFSYLERNITKNDRLWIFFAGHGSNQGILLFDSLMYYEELLLKISKIDAQEVVLILDACHSGNINFILEEIQNITKNNNLLKTKISVILTSTSSFTIAQDGIPGANGWFTDNFLKSLDKDNLELLNLDRNKDNKVSLFEVYKSTHNLLEKKIRETDDVSNEPNKIGLPTISDEEKAMEVILYRYEK